jgi:predicted RNA-binding Zn ribbon-like protein
MPRHAFISGNAGLDLAGTLKWRHGPAPEDLLVTAADLREWIEQSGLITSPPAVSAPDVRRVRDLREAVYRAVTAARTGRRPADADLALLNATAAQPPLAFAVAAGRLETYGDITALMSNLARDALGAISVDSALLKECARPPCTRVFIDRTRGKRRTWCGMNECGARVKVAAYRDRQRRQST